MSTTEDFARLKLDLDSAEFDRKADANRTAMGELAAAFARGEVTAHEFDAELKLLANQQGSLDRLSAGLGGATNRMAGLGQAGLQAGRVMQDFTQGGIGGILNNIEGLSMALGGGAGLAGILTMVGTAAFVLKPKIMELIESFKADSVKVFAGELERLQARIKELQDRPIRLAVDTFEIEQAEKRVRALQTAKQAFESLSQKRTEREQESGAAVEKEFTEAPGGAAALADALKTKIARDLTAGDQAINDANAQLPALEEQIRKLTEEMATADAKTRATFSRALADQEAKAKKLREDAQAARSRIGKDAEIAVGDITKGAFAGDPAKQKQLRDHLAGLGGDAANLGMRLEGMNPEKIVTREQNAERKKAAEDALKEAEDALKEAEARRKKADDQVEALNVQGIEGQQIADRERDRAVQGAKKYMGMKVVAAPDAAAKAREAQLALRIMQQSAPMTGVQFTPQQARAAAKKSLDMQAQGANAMQATQTAMGDVISAMMALSQRMAIQEANGNQLGRNARALSRTARKR